MKTRTEPLSPLKSARRDKILDAAEHLFVTHGHRATTMEGVAQAVGMSKVTVYGYFRDKDAIFSAVAERLAGRLKSAVESALQQPGPMTERISNALVAKHSMVFDVVRSSAFAGELFAAKTRIVADTFMTLDGEIQELLSRTIGQQGISSEKSDRLAGLLFAASQGIANHANDFTQIELDIRTLVKALL